MEILDRIYKTFKNLDRDFSKSKKSRSEFILGKFGGDIEIGSMILLDAANADADQNSPDDIEKLTFLKNTFDQIREMGGNVESFGNFKNLTDTTQFDRLIATLSDSMQAGTGVSVVPQLQLNKESGGAFHFYSTAAGTSFAPIRECKVLYLYNEHFMGLVEQRFNNPANLNRGDYLSVSNHVQTNRIQRDRAAAILKK